MSLVVIFWLGLQELQAEKQKTGRVESVLHEHRVAREKDIMQVKAQSFQEMQIKVINLFDRWDCHAEGLDLTMQVIIDYKKACLMWYVYV